MFRIDPRCILCVRRNSFRLMCQLVSGGGSSDDYSAVYFLSSGGANCVE